MSELERLLALPLPVLERLARVVSSGRLEVPPSEASLLSEHLDALVPHLPLLRCFGERAALATMVEAVVRLRRREHERPRPELVWTGPEPRRGRARRTAVVVEDLLRGARSEVFIAGYSFEGGEELLEPLQQAMRERGVTTRIVLDGSGWKVYEATPEARILEGVVRQFWDRTWREPAPRPELYYDPRTLTRQPPLRGSAWFPEFSMHAKCVVVDRARVLVGSANFTARAQTRNLEVGVALHDPELAEALLHQWQAAIGEGMIRKA